MSDWHSRGYLPHCDEKSITQSVTFRLVDSFPSIRLEEWKTELSSLPPQQAEYERRQRIEEYLDKGYGEAWLSNPCIANLVSQALRYFDHQRYELHSWVIMPNHVHVLLTLDPKESISRILHSWKSYTSTKANALLERDGTFWQREYFDRLIRNQRHFENVVSYIENNPVKAGLCKAASDWRFGSAFQD